jgi:pyruvate,orthophosphate dikinase
MTRARLVRLIPDSAMDDPDTRPEIMGAKAYNLLRMAKAGLPVPPAFVLTTHAWRRYHAEGDALIDALTEAVGAQIRWLERASGAAFGSARRPLLVSVRSGAPVSLPGMMETILNVGLNDTSLRGLIRATGNPRMAWDCYRRLIECYAEVVHGARSEPFRRSLERAVAAEDLASAAELDTEALRNLAQEYLGQFEALTSAPFPQDPMDQLHQAIGAVFRSWTSPKAVEFRRLNGIDDDLGTAVTVQMMVFGNAGGTSGAGVGFTRNPATGADELYLDFLANAQGEDVVSGRQRAGDADLLLRLLPSVHAELMEMRGTLEREFHDLQDFEFTVQDGQLYLLQTRAGKRTPWAALAVAVDLVECGLIDAETALLHLAEIDLDALVRTRLVRATGVEPIARATPASVGVAVGQAAFDPERAAALAGAGRPVILLREDASTEDIAGIALSAGLVTAAGARTSHAAVVARQLGKVCLVGCRDLVLDAGLRHATLGGRRIGEGETLSLDGETGEIFLGTLPIEEERPSDALAKVAAWRNTRARASA